MLSKVKPLTECVLSKLPSGSVLEVVIEAETHKVHYGIVIAEGGRLEGSIFYGLAIGSVPEQGFNWWPYANFVTDCIEVGKPWYINGLTTYGEVSVINLVVKP